MIDETQEFLLSQALDGQLSDAQIRVLDEQLRSDEQLALEAGQYEKLDDFLHGVTPLPQKGWDDLAAVISHRIDLQTSQRAASAQRWRWAGGLAIAAAVVLSIGGALWFSHAPGPAGEQSPSVAISTQPPGQPAPAGALASRGGAVVIVGGTDTPAVAAGLQVQVFASVTSHVGGPISVQIGPSEPRENTTQIDVAELLVQSTRVMIAGGAAENWDATRLPF